MGLLSGLLALVGCDQQKIVQLEEGVSTEADVRAQFGQPEAVWDAPASAPAGTKVLEYNRQPEGTTNYQISIGPDGKMSALRQLLTRRNFALILPGMPSERVRTMLGKPAKTEQFAIQKDIIWTYRFTDPDLGNGVQLFSITFDPDLHVTATGITAEVKSPGA